MSIFLSRQPVFFVDDDEKLRHANAQSLELAGMEVRPFAEAAAALKEVDRDFPGIVVTDIRMPHMDGLQLFARLREIDPDIPVILITGHADVPTAVAALRDGAFDFLAKPFAADHLVAAAEKALQTRRLVIENRRLRAAVEEEGGNPLIGDSPAMARLRETLAQVAKADVDVLVEGETGSGKELAARLLHRQGPRRGRPFVAVNCGALPEELAEAELFGHDLLAPGHAGSTRTGRVEASNRGTLFLDEVDSMSGAVQAKLLRVLEEREIVPIGAGEPRPIDLRVVAASKRNLQELVDEGGFRQDLFYRLNVVRLRIPPLRERRQDVPQLFAHFVEEALQQVGGSSFAMTDEIRRHLVEHDWPGNVRELRNFALSAVLGLTGASAAAGFPAALALPQRVERFEAMLIRDALEESGGDIRATLSRLGIPRKTLYDKMARHGIDPNQFRPARRAGNPAI
jgi:two-component system C4-dicarboxylate transport response regulator DctD